MFTNQPISVPFTGKVDSSLLDNIIDQMNRNHLIPTDFTPRYLILSLWHQLFLLINHEDASKNIDYGWVKVTKVNDTEIAVNLTVRGSYLLWVLSTIKFQLTGVNCIFTHQPIITDSEQSTVFYKQINVKDNENETTKSPVSIMSVKYQWDRAHIKLDERLLNNYDEVNDTHTSIMLDGYNITLPYIKAFITSLMERVLNTITHDTTRTLDKLSCVTELTTALNVMRTELLGNYPNITIVNPSSYGNVMSLMMVQGPFFSEQLPIKMRVITSNHVPVGTCLIGYVSQSTNIDSRFILCTSSYIDTVGNEIKYTLFDSEQSGYWRIFEI